MTNLHFNVLQGLSKICKTVVDLRTLNIGQCSAVTDSGLAAVAGRLLQLEDIDLYGCSAVTQAGVERLRLGCTNIKRVNFNLWH